MWAVRKDMPKAVKLAAWWVGRTDIPQAVLTAGHWAEYWVSMTARRWAAGLADPMAYSWAHPRVVSKVVLRVVMRASPLDARTAALRAGCWGVSTVVRTAADWVAARDTHSVDRKAASSEVHWVDSTGCQLAAPRVGWRDNDWDKTRVEQTEARRAGQRANWWVE